MRKFLPAVVALSAVVVLCVVSSGADARRPLPTSGAAKDTLILKSGAMDARPERVASGAKAETLVIEHREKRPVEVSLGRHGKIHIEGNRQGDVVLMGEDIVVQKDQVVEGDAVAIGGSVTVLGQVRGDAVAVGGRITLGDSAIVNGDVVSVGSSLEISPSAIVKGEKVQVGISPWSTSRNKHIGSLEEVARMHRHGPGYFFRWLVFYLIFFAFAALAVTLGRDRLHHAGQYLGHEPFPSFILGFLSPVIVLIGGVLLCITLVGIPVAIVLILLYPLFVFLGWVVAGLRIGQSVSRDAEPGVPIRTLFIGLLVISGLHMLSVLLSAFGLTGLPVTMVKLIGFTVSFTAALCGLGAIMGTRFRPTPVTAAPYGQVGPGGPPPGAPPGPGPFYGAPAPPPYAPPQSTAPTSYTPPPVPPNPRP